jgi:hypothetical protein
MLLIGYIKDMVKSRLLQRLEEEAKRDTVSMLHRLFKDKESANSIRNARDILTIIMQTCQNLTQILSLS